MNNLTKLFALCAAISLLIAGCSGQRVNLNTGEPAKTKIALYESLLGKSLADDDVAKFIVNNHCSSTVQAQLCEKIGMALWIDSNQTVETVYLYLNNGNDFEPYTGELPYGLKFYDTMGAVEYRLKRQGIGNAGLPNAAGTPDHVHYLADYRQVDMTILYNSPVPDEDATIYAIVVRR